MKLENMRTGTRLALGFSLVVGLTLLMGISSIFVVTKLGSLTADLYHHPLAVSNAVRDIRTNIVAMHRSMKDVVLAENDAQLMGAVQKVDQYEQNVHVDFDIIFERFLGDLGDVKKAHQSFIEWKTIRDEVIRLTQEGKKKQAAVITKGKGATHITELDEQIQFLTSFASNKADTFFNDAQKTRSKALAILIVFLITSFALGIIISLLISKSITEPLSEIVKGIKAIATGDLDMNITIQRDDEVGELALSLRQMVETLKSTAEQANIIAGGDYSADVKARSEKDELGIAMRSMTRNLREISAANQRSIWLKNGQSELDDMLRGENSVQNVAEKIVNFVTRYLGAQVGVLYFANDNDKYTMLASYAFQGMKDLPNEFAVGEGLVGQAVREKETIIVTQLPEDYLKITSSLGEKTPHNVIITPFVHDDQVKAVLEIGSFSEFAEWQTTFMEEIADRLAIVINAVLSRGKLKEMLKVTQRQAENLETQQEELQVANEELEDRTERLKTNKAELQAQQEELRVTNEELENKTESLEAQKKEIEEQNRKLMDARKTLEKKAEELAVASKYKSEFLANMSHELRTPLNSLLLLARTLENNREGNLTEDQLESAVIIRKSGNELLTLINEILDLSKIEAGQMVLEIEQVYLPDVANNIQSSFQHVAEEKGITLDINIDQTLPVTLMTDRQRLEQILYNFLSNAIKFTKEGSVNFQVTRPEDSQSLNDNLGPDRAISFSVTDTGIGISSEQQKSIFEAFQQADGSTTRKYGGTGLGLSISRELAAILGGEIRLKSKPGKGSTFSLILPEKQKQKKTDGPLDTIQHDRTAVGQDDNTAAFFDQKNSAPSIVFSFTDDRDTVIDNDHVILVIEDDESFANILYKQSNAKGFKCIVSPDGEQGLDLAVRYKPVAIILDIKLPGISGWHVLDYLKKNPDLRHIPVHMMSAEESKIDALKKGAISFLTKPISDEQLHESFLRIEHILNRQLSSLLVVEDEDPHRQEIIKLIGNGDVQSTEAKNGEEALNAIRNTKFDCVVLDIGLPDMSGFDVLDKLEEEQVEIPPVIIYTARELTREENQKLRQYTESIIVKGVKSEERLLDETALFLHRVVGNLPEKKRKMIASLHSQDTLLDGKTVLLVDDDMRNTFALARILKEKNLEVEIASDGKQALEILDENSNVDLVLMDIMMPVMDGLEATREIRNQGRFEDLPIIALTAKAMKEDRDNCMKAGASDYLAKPVDVERLLSMMRVWLYR